MRRSKLSAIIEHANRFKTRRFPPSNHFSIASVPKNHPGANAHFKALASINENYTPTRSYATIQGHDEFYIKSPSSEEEYTALTNQILNESQMGQMSIPILGKSKELIKYWSKMRTEDGAWKAEQILERIHAEGQVGNNPFAFVTTTMYTEVIHAWSHSGSYDGPMMADAVFRRMDERHEKFKENYDQKNVKNQYKAAPTKALQNLVILSWVLSGREEAISKVEEIISNVESKEKKGTNTKSYNMLINLYANQKGDFDSAQKAENVLLHMAELKKDGNLDVSPDTLSFNTVLKAWKNSDGGIDASERALDILRIMIKLSEDGHEEIVPDDIGFKTVLFALSKTAEYDGRRNSEAFETADKLQDLVTLMMKSFTGEEKYALPLIKKAMRVLERSGLPDSTKRLEYLVKTVEGYGFDLEFDSELYSSIIGTYAKKGDTYEARRILQRLIDDKSLPNPDPSCFNKILNVECKQEKRAEAEELYQLMKNLASRGDFVCHPDTSTYNIMMDLYFREKKKDALEKSMTLLDEYETAILTGNLKEVGYYPYNAMLQKICTSKMKGKEDIAYGILMKMIQHFESGRTEHPPGIVTFNTALSILANGATRSSAEKAHMLLEQMERSKRDGTSDSACVDQYSYTHTILAWCRANEPDSIEKIFEVFAKCKERDLDEAFDVQLDSVVFETIFLALSSMKSKQNALKAVKLLEEMIALYKGGRVDLKPSSKCINLVVKAHSSSTGWSNAEPSRLHDLVISLANAFKHGNIYMDHIAFNIAVQNWTRANKTVAPNKGLFLRKKMNEIGISPSAQCNLSMMNAYAKSDWHNVAVQAQKFVNTLDENEMNLHCYNVMLNLWAKSDSNEKVMKCRQILEHMHTVGKVDVISYNTVMNACAFSKVKDENEKRKHLNEAQRTHEELLQFLDPDEISFATIVKASRKLSSSEDELDRILKETFETCSRRGFLGKVVIREFKYSTTPEKRLELFGNDLEGTICSQWVRHIND